jgi:LysM repeat protein
MKKIALILFYFSISISVFAGGKEEITKMPQFESIEDMLTFTMKQQRKPYRNGAEGPNAFDCSGFTRFCYKKLGITLNRSSIEQVKNGKKIRFRRHLREGDLVFFKGTKGRKVGHVGIVYKKKSGKSFEFIHASSNHGIVIESSDVEYFKKRYKKARRITSDRDIRKAIRYFEKAQKEMEERAESFDNEDDIYAKTSEAKASSSEKSKSSGKTHIVKKGDTLYNISKRYGCTVKEIQEWNDLRGNEISLGQELILKN